MLSNCIKKEVNDMADKIKMTKSSGNIFADLGVKNAEERLAKAKLALTINQIIAKRKLTQVAAGKILKINQPKISALANGRLAGFSIERLIDFLNKLDQDVEIVIHEKPKNRKFPATFSVSVIY
jgi:predicted XRE-type DNA-binding protein